MGLALGMGDADTLITAKLFLCSAGLAMQLFLDVSSFHKGLLGA